jgi:hypothetical protein
VHEHRDQDGRVIGTTVVRREPEFDDRLRAEYLAEVGYDDRCCRSCGNFDTLVEVKESQRHVTWDEHGGRVMDVHHFICLACASTDIIKRDFEKRYEKVEPKPGQASPTDGRLIVAAPLSAEG